MDENVESSKADSKQRKEEIDRKYKEAFPTLPIRLETKREKKLREAENRQRDDKSLSVLQAWATEEAKKKDCKKEHYKEGLLIQDPLLWLGVGPNHEVFCILTNRNLSLRRRGPDPLNFEEAEVEVINFITSNVKCKLHTRVRGKTDCWVQLKMPRLSRHLKLLTDHSLCPDSSCTVEQSRDLVDRDASQVRNIQTEVEEWIDMAKCSLENVGFF